MGLNGLPSIMPRDTLPEARCRNQRVPGHHRKRICPRHESENAPRRHPRCRVEEPDPDTAGESATAIDWRSGITTLAQLTRARGGAERRRGRCSFCESGWRRGWRGRRPSAASYGVAVDDRLIAPGWRWSHRRVLALNFRPDFIHWRRSGESWPSVSRFAFVLDDPLAPLGTIDSFCPAGGVTEMGWVAPPFAWG
jgi:hypothetical protein